MNILYKTNTFLKNCENILLSLILYNKFIVRNKVHNKTYIIENGFIFFHVKESKLKKNLKHIKNKYTLFLKLRKKHKNLKRLYKSSYINDKNQNINLIEFLTTKIVIKKLKTNYYEQKKIKITKKNYEGFSFFGKPVFLKKKQNKKFLMFKKKFYQILKKKNFFNFIQHKLFLLKFFFKIMHEKSLFSGFILKTKKGGFICRSNIFIIQAFLPKSQAKNILHISLNQKQFLHMFSLYGISNIYDIKILYNVYTFYKNTQDSCLTSENKYKKKLIFPLFVGSIKKTKKRISKKKAKKFFKLKRLKLNKFNILKKTTYFYKKKFFYKAYNVIFISKKNSLLPVKLSKLEKYILKTNKNYRILIQRLLLRIQNLKSKEEIYV